MNMTTEQKQSATFYLVSLALNLIVAVGNWQLYSRVRKMETILGLRATPQSQQRPSLVQLPKNSG